MSRLSTLSQLILRPALAGTVAAVWTVVATIAYASLVFAGPLAPALSIGISTILSGFVVSSFVIALGSGQTGMTASNLTVAAPVYAAMGLAISSEFTALGLTDPFTQAAAVSLASGAATLLTGLFFVALGSFGLGSFGQLLPYPVVAGYNSGIGWFLLVGGLKLALDRPGGLLEPTPIDQTAIMQLAALGLTALVIVVTPLRVRHWAVLPAVLGGAILIFHLARLAGGVGIASAQQAHWVFGPFSGSFLRLPAIAGVIGIDVGLIRRLAPYIVGSVFIAAVTQILVLSALETDLRRTFALNHELSMAGAANIAGGLVGGLPAGQALQATMLLSRQTGPSRFAALIPAVWGIVLLLTGTTLLAYLPRFAVGALLVAIGFERFILRVAEDARTNPRLEIVIAIIVSLGIIFLGILNGLAIGVAAAIALFAYNYRRIPVVWATVSGANVRSNVVRSPSAMALLASEGTRIVLFRLQGYLFFLNVSALRDLVETRAGETPPLTDVIFDFRDVVGTDSSALVAFRRIGQIAEEKGFRIFLAGVDPALHDLLTRARIFVAERVVAADTADRALQAAEDRLIAGSESTHEPRTLEATLADMSHDLKVGLSADRLAPYVERLELQPGDIVMRVGDPADAMFFVERGQVTAELERAGEAPLRLQTFSPGAFVGEIAVYRGGVRTASVRAETACLLVRLSRSSLDRMDNNDPDLARLLQRLIIVELADKLANATRLVDAGLQ